MDQLTQMLIDAGTTLLPVAVSTLSPVAVAAVKLFVGDKLPASAKPVLNGLFGVLIAGIFGGDAATGIAGAMVGNRVREAAQAVN